MSQTHSSLEHSVGNLNKMEGMDWRRQSAIKFTGKHTVDYTS